HREEDRIDPQLVAHEQLDQVPVEMQDEIDQPRQHGSAGYREARVRGKRTSFQGTSARMATGRVEACAKPWPVLRASSATRTSASRSASAGEPLAVRSSAGASPGPSSTRSGTMPLP